MTEPVQFALLWVPAAWFSSPTQVLPDRMPLGSLVSSTSSGRLHVFALRELHSMASITTFKID